MHNFEIEDLMGFMQKNISYGYIDKNGKRHEEVDEMFADNYALQSPEQLLKTLCGVCWDQVEFEREYFMKKGHDYKTYFIVYYDNEDCPSHTFLAYQLNDSWYWFENSWGLHRGIYEYCKIEDLLKDVKDKFIKTLPYKDINHMNLCIYEYEKPSSSLGCLAFYKHAEAGKNIIVG